MNGVVQGDTLDFDPYRARYCDIVETRGFFYWNPHAILGWKHFLIISMTPICISNSSKTSIYSDINFQKDLHYFPGFQEQLMISVLSWDRETVLPVYDLKTSSLDFCHHLGQKLFHFWVFFRSTPSWIKSAPASSFREKQYIFRTITRWFSVSSTLPAISDMFPTQNCMRIPIKQTANLYDVAVTRQIGVEI